MIYLASPYSHPDPEVKEARFIAASRAAAYLMNRGEYVYCPIAHTHPMALYGGLDGNWEWWKDYDTYMMGLCDEVRVLMLDGWLVSTGVNAEIDIALEKGLAVYYLEPTDVGL